MTGKYATKIGMVGWWQFFKWKLKEKVFGIRCVCSLSGGPVFNGERCCEICDEDIDAQPRP